MRRWAKWVLGIVLGLFGVVLILGGIALALYLADTRIDADVVDRDCDAFGDSTLRVKTSFFGFDIERDAEIGYQECSTLPDTAVVHFYIRSHRTIVYASEGGACIWDSENGPCA